jgi:hypothetical protein
MRVAPIDRPQFRTGLLLGTGAFLAGLALTFLVGTLGVGRGVELLVAVDPLQGTVVAFASLHLWPLALGGAAGWFLVWTLVPAVVLTVAGYAAASGAPPGIGDEDSGGDGDEGFRRGASVAVGYFGLTVLAFLLVVVLGGGQTGAIGFGGVAVGVLFTGVLFPLVFGGLGGTIATGR